MMYIVFQTKMLQQEKQISRNVFRPEMNRYKSE
jgi:hypothetical protein